MPSRPLHEIAAEIICDWKRPYFGAVPYLDAMRYLGDIDDEFGDQDADEIVVYFLSNAASWRGATARRVKTELKEMIS
jgi:hypothetical protein